MRELQLAPERNSQNQSSDTPPNLTRDYSPTTDQIASSQAQLLTGICLEGLVFPQKLPVQGYSTNMRVSNFLVEEEKSAGFLLPLHPNQSKERSAEHLQRADAGFVHNAAEFFLRECGID